MNCPPVKSPEVQEQLCGLLYYPGKCSNMCNRMYNRWLVESEEVRRLEGKEIPAEEVEKVVLRKKKIPLDLMNLSLSSSLL